MAIKTLLTANMKAHRGTMLGIFSLFFLVALSLTAVLTVWQNSARYVNSEMDRMGYGDLTVWVSGLEDAAPLVQEITASGAVEQVGVQPLVFSEYQIGEQESDSEGQLVPYEPDDYPYRILTADLSAYQTEPSIPAPGEIYVSPSLCSMFGVRIGDRITFPIARSGVEKTFVIAGFFEDPFMGSSMIGMKSFLICGQDHEEISGIIAQAGTDGLAREGFMLHIFQATDSGRSASAFNMLLNAQTGLQRYTEFAHSRESISGFMLTLQNTFTCLLLSFAAVLLLAAAVVLSHSIGSTLAQDYGNMGILKTLGFTSSRLRSVQLLQYLSAALPGMAAGTALSVPVSGFVCRMTVTTTGLLVPDTLPAGLLLSVLAAVVLLLLAFVWLRTGRIARISPVSIMRGGEVEDKPARRARLPLRKAGLGFWMALRQLLTGGRRYIGACAVAVLLVFFASLVGRVNAWLWPEGQGLMDAFNPADLHIAVQPIGETSAGDVERTIEEYTEITDSYELAMPGVSVNGVDMTANVITQPERFHLLAGRTCSAADEVVLTEFAAADLGVGIGDTVTVAGVLGSGEYTVSGIYQCANDMGMNLGMNRAGYDRIGEETPTMWCTHYFIADPDRQPAVMQALEERYGGDVYLHENTWPGLFGILSAMQMLMRLLYGVTAVFVLLTTLLTTGKLLRAERRDMAVYCSVGFPAGALRRSFAVRFGLTALLGSALGTLLSGLCSDPPVAVLMRLEGISNYASHPGMAALLLPGAVVTLLFTGFAWMAAGQIRTVPLTMLTVE